MKTIIVLACPVDFKLSDYISPPPVPHIASVHLVLAGAVAEISFTPKNSP